MSLSKTFAFLLLAGAALAAPVFAYVSPGAPTGYVNDFVDVIPAGEQASLENSLATFNQKTGGEITVAVVSALGGDDIESYANTLFREWGVGSKEDDTGILLVVAIEDREVRIEVGYGYEGAVPDAYASRIIRDDIIPRFQDDDYPGGITAGVASLITLIQDPESVPPPGEPSLSFEDWATLGGLLFIAASWLFAIMARTKSWWLGGVFGSAVALVLGLLFGTTIGLIAALPLVLVGLLIDFAVSSAYREAKNAGVTPPWWTGGGGSWSGGSGGGFGGFGGGSSGGGGASGRW
jgi:uncharacterized protein